MIQYLVSRDSKGKIRVACVSFEWDDEQHGFVISRLTGQLGGKMTEQPDILVQRGKAKRTVTEQTQLEFNALVRKYTDKGYKAIENDPSTYSEDELNEIIGEEKTDTNGFMKHMLAKQADQVSDATINKVPYWYASRKIDGVRCSFYYADGEVHTASRGGKNYDYSTWQIREHPKLVEFLKRYPKIILDGELYKHGKSLQQISGAARMEKTAKGNDWLEYYIYDVMLPTTFEQRLKVLNAIKKTLELDFNPSREWKPNELRIQMVPHEKVSGKDNILALHDKYVSEGWEGCVVRDPNGSYKFGGRGSEMVKFKLYKESEFVITGLSEGLRDEDMCFTLETADGIPFKAKPMGSRDIKDQYRKDLNQLIGRMATVKYFYLSDEGTPLQPVLKSIRDYE